MIPTNMDARNPFLPETTFSCRGKVVLGYNEVELCMKGSGYNFIHAADMMYCADNHIRSKSDPECVSGASMSRTRL